MRYFIFVVSLCQFRLATFQVLTANPWLPASIPNSPARASATFGSSLGYCNGLPASTLAFLKAFFHKAARSDSQIMSLPFLKPSAVSHHNHQQGPEAGSLPFLHHLGLAPSLATSPPDPPCGSPSLSSKLPAPTLPTDCSLCPGHSSPSWSVHSPCLPFPQIQPATCPLGSQSLREEKLASLYPLCREVPSCRLHGTALAAAGGSRSVHSPGPMLEGAQVLSALRTPRCIQVTVPNLSL